MFGSLESFKFVCLSCRVTAKTRSVEPLCPSCGGTMIGMGYDFKTPKKTDDKGWKEVEELIKRRSTSWADIQKRHLANLYKNKRG